jgi:2-polyprenyl-3-methyl-5-hydroxy-6-metoxy-1,4-benzoquinol methylase
MGELSMGYRGNADHSEVSNPGRRDEIGPAVDRVYTNGGNTPLIDLLNGKYCRILDVGCGAGNNAALVKARSVECDIYGITHSSAEAELARAYMSECWVMDLESDFPARIEKESLDVLIFSHVLEHLRHPEAVVAHYCELLRHGGLVLIAIPNVLSFKMRYRFLKGNFEYESAGVMDDTHLHFYTYFTADRYLLAKSPDLKIMVKTVTGSFPLWKLRGHLFPREVCNRIDGWGTQHWPNLFGHQILIKAVKD